MPREVVATGGCYVQPQIAEHDILVVTEDGSRNLTGFPFGPEHNIVPLR